MKPLAYYIFLAIFFFTFQFLSWPWAIRFLSSNTPPTWKQTLLYALISTTCFIILMAFIDLVLA